MEDEYKTDGTRIAREEAIQMIADCCGYEAQSRQCVEEMSELTQAINKFWREGLEYGEIRFEEIDFTEVSEYIADLLEEITDVQIMLDQMKYLLRLNESLMDRMDVYKINRTLERI